MPDPAEHSARRSTGAIRTTVLAVIVGVVGAAVTWFRLTPEARGTLWAEDDTVFFHQLVEHGLTGTLFLPYQGYLHVVPRLLAAGALATVPLAGFALAVTACSCAVIGIVCAGTAVLARPMMRSRVLVVLVALVPALVPMGPVETAGNLANLHWYLLFLLPWVLLYPVRSWAVGLVLGVVTLLVALTEVQAVVFVPLLLVGIRARQRTPVVAALVVGVLAQLGATVLSPRDQFANAGTTLKNIAAGYVVEVVGGSADWDVARVGRRVLADGIVPIGLVAAAVLAVLVIAVAVARGPGAPRSRLLVVVLTLASAVLWTLANRLNVVPGYVSPTGLLHLRTVRYAVVASALLIAALVVAADILLERRRGFRRASVRFLTAGVGGLVVLTVLTSFAVNAAGVVGGRRAGPEWAPQVGRALAQCAAAPDAPVALTAAPTTAPWSTVLACDELPR